jgi:hypothetical protein
MGVLTIIMQLLFILAVLFIVVALARNSALNSCPGPKVVYRYVPRSFREEQEYPQPLDDTFYGMFNNSDPWMAPVDVDRKRNDIGENLNRYYVSRI